MNTMDAICSRKSVRSYTGENISEAELKQILKAAYAAPVGMKAYDTLILTVVTNQAFMDKLNADSAAMMGRPDAVPLYGAPMLIIVSSTLPGGARDNVAHSNAACIVENIALEAVELGIGTCHIWGAIRALNANPELLKELELPEGYVPCCAVILGHTDETYELREIPMDRIKTDYLE